MTDASHSVTTAENSLRKTNSNKGQPSGEVFLLS